MNAAYLPGTARRGIGSAILLLGGSAWLLLPASVNAAGLDAAAFADEPAAHAAYNRMIEAMHQARSLSYTSRYECEAEGRFLTTYTYRVWLKKPNFFRMETRSSSGELEGILIGDGTRLWIHWPKGRPQWKYVVESEADRKTRFTSYMTKPAPRGRHSIAHEAPFLGAKMGYPAVLDASVSHGHVASTERYLDAVRKAGAETIGGEDCDKIEVSLMDHQRSSYLWLSKRDHLPRKLKEVVRVSSDVVMREEWSSVTVDQEIPAGTFAWAPPVGWTEWKLPDEEDSLLKPGSKAPDFDLTSVGGGRIKLSDFRGKTVWLCFWRVGCPPCRQEMPYLQSLYAKYKDQGLVVLGVNVLDDRAITREFLRERGVTFPNILDASPRAEEVYSRDYRVGTIPLNYLINGDGIVVDGWIGNLEGNARVNSALRTLGFGAAGSER
jgi:peroxiredoxin/outer membrane lipoprotein-sorting protein